MPLWLKWRWEAAKQWNRDFRGVPSPEPSVRLTNKRISLVNGCASGDITCALCGAPYEVPNFKSVMAHMYATHPQQAARMHLHGTEA